MRILNSILLTFTVFCLTACTATYTPAQDEATAKLNLRGMAMGGSFQKRFCHNGSFSFPKEADNGYGLIPAGKRITVEGSYSDDRRSCSAYISFIPVAGMSYYPDFERAGGRCRILIHREDESQKTGFAFEPSLAPREDCQSR